MAGVVATVQPALQLLANFALPTIEQTQLGRYPPINFLYGHFHNSIREELGLLQVRVQSLEASGDGNVVAVLKQLHDRYKFLEQVYKYHSTVEDEVLYPVLDSKVRNVTLAYSIEHQDEEFLFEQLSKLLSTALEEPESQRKGTIRTLICKVEEVHTSLRKHLAKEEEQLLPLLLQHFTYAEQAELVVQFLYSIPLETVERVLSQLKPRIPREEQEQLLEEIRRVIPDNLLSQLLTTWLEPAEPAAAADIAAAAASCTAEAHTSGWCIRGAHSAPASAASTSPITPLASFECCGNPGQCMYASGPAATPTQPPEGSTPLCASPPAPAAPPAPSSPPARAPLQDIIHFHRSICDSLADFVRETRSLRAHGREVTAGQLSSLLERHRFLRSVYVFHSLSEEEVLFPEVQRLAMYVGDGAAQQCEKDHAAELSSFEDLGRMLADVRAFARRGRKEVCAMLEKLCTSAEAVHTSTRYHMEREETDVFPLLEAHLCEQQQRMLLYRTIRAMPLRLLERVMPWVVSRLDGGAASALLTNIRLGAPAGDQALVQLLSRWARRGRRDVGQQQQQHPAGPGVDTEPDVSCHGGVRMPRAESAEAPAPAAVGAAAEENAVAATGGQGAGGAWVEGRSPPAMAAGGGGTWCRGSGAEECQEPDCKRRRLSGTPQPTNPVAGGSPSGSGEANAAAGGGVPGLVRCSSGSGSDMGAAGWATDAGAGAGSHSGVGGYGGAGPGAAAVNRGDDGEMGFMRFDCCEELSTAPRALMRAHACSRGHTPLPGAAGMGAGAGAQGPAGGSGHAAQGADGSHGGDCCRAADHHNAGGRSHSAPPHHSLLDAPHLGMGAPFAPPMGGARAGGSVPLGNGYNPIDHIFQFHKALRQEIKQLEADATALEHTVMSRMRQQQQLLQHTQQPHAHAPLRPSSSCSLQRGGEEGNSGARGTGSKSGTPQHSGLHHPRPSKAGVQLNLVQQQQQQNGRAGTPPPAPTPARTPTPAMSDAVGSTCSTGPGGAGTDSTGVAYSRGGQLPVVQHLHGRFQFLQGIYRAHSKSEDEIVFPALEAKQALRNVSHAYTLDHRQEEQMFADAEAVIDALRSADLTAPNAEEEVSRLVMSVRRMCAAIRASLETHIRSEESELWPLFSEHFSREEQQYLVGVIIGRTGAQVLQALLPWVSETFSAEEKEAMMDSLREATRNTMFDQWLEAVQAGAGGPGGPGGPAAAAGAPRSSDGGASGAEQLAACGCVDDTAAVPGHHQQHQHQQDLHNVNRPLQQVAEYLAGGEHGSSGVRGASCSPHAAAGGGSGSSLADSTSFRPGWEDIFRMNQQQLEAAIHRVSNDSSLEPERKAYLMQNIMVSKYIVAQQRRMGAAAAGSGPSSSAGGVSAPSSSTGGGACQHHAATAAATAITAAAQPAEAAVAAAMQQQQQVGEGAAAFPASIRTYHNEAAGVLGCRHYQRKCQLVAPCCGQIHTCRLCHDEACDHRMDRYAVSEMRCMLCGLRQPVAGACAGCGTSMSRYFCNICHLFDDEPGKHIYHCPFCNVCRRGRGLGVDFFHCMNCNACMSLSLFSTHKCREKCIEGNCPVCHEALFDSSQPIKELPCGHFMHSTCFLTYTRYNYTCPLCCKSVGDMSVYFQMLDSLLAAERLPPEYSGRMQQVLCNDCGKMGFAPFHFVYHSCPHCRSYNTRVL